ncbi:MAG: hypothetical protein AB8F34_07450 [Akkermansiaceae bacterium]
MASSPAKGQEATASSAGARFSAKLEEMLASLKSSRYQHRTDIDVLAGRFNCDCSGLLGYVLSNSFPEAFLALKGDLAPWKSRPLAATFYQTFDRVGEHGNGLWQRVPRLIDVRPGDLIAWRKPELEKGKSTGHVCMVAGFPLIEEDGRIRIRVIDSTNKPHENDTRRDEKNGFGAGEMWFKVNNKGRPVAYISRKGGKQIGSNLILIGRLQSGKKIAVTPNAADRDFIGLDEKEAAKLAKQRGLTWRIISRNGVTSPVSLFRQRTKRLNFVLEQGKVERVRRG